MRGIEGRELPVPRPGAVRNEGILPPCVLSGERSSPRTGRGTRQTDREQIRGSEMPRRCTTVR